MKSEQRSRIERAAVEIAKRLGAAAGESNVEDEGCEGVGFMGQYERRHFGLGDFEQQFVARLRRTVERALGTGRDLDEIERECWLAWISARNTRVRELCPRAKEYGSE